MTEDDHREASRTTEDDRITGQDHAGGKGRARLVLLHIWQRLRYVWSETDYAQKRMLEINSGQILTPETKRRAARAEVSSLNAALALDACEPPRDPRPRVSP